MGERHARTVVLALVLAIGLALMAAALTAGVPAEHTPDQPAVTCQAHCHG